MNQHGAAVDRDLRGPGVIQRIQGSAPRVRIEEQSERGRQSQPVAHHSDTRTAVPGSEVLQRGDDTPGGSAE